MVHFGRLAGCFVERMSCVIDGSAVAAADVAVADGKAVVVGLALAGDYVVHMAAAETGKTDEAVETA